MYQGIFIDAIETDKRFLDMMSTKGRYGLQFTFQKPSEFLTLTQNLVNHQPDLLALDYRLNNRSGKLGYTAGALAQQLRELATESIALDFPIVLLSSQDDLKAFCNNLTVHNLFDLSLTKEHLPDESRLSQKMLSLVKGYKFLIKNWDKPERWSHILGLKTAERLRIAYQAIRELDKLQAPHQVARDILRYVINRPGILLDNINKNPIPASSLLIVLGGPAMLIGLGGGAASSMAAGQSHEALDFASVQRGNPEMQRRCQEVIDACWRMGADNPIYSVHDVGAGGLSNALPELVEGSDRGGRFEFGAILAADPSLSKLEMWCNESQERYVLAIAQDNLPLFQALCERERCPFAVVGEATAEQHLSLSDADKSLIDMPLSVLFGNPPSMRREISAQLSEKGDISLSSPFAKGISILEEAALRVLHLPTVANKSFLITIGDRTVGGLVVRSQMVGPWQVPVADCAVTATTFGSRTGEAMAIGERTPLALLNAPASGRMAIGEAITNIAAAIDDISDIVLSANWMALAWQPGEDVALFETVKAVGMTFCPALGIKHPRRQRFAAHTMG